MVVPPGFEVKMESRLDLGHIEPTPHTMFFPDKLRPRHELPMAPVLVPVPPSEAGVQPMVVEAPVVATSAPVFTNPIPPPQPQHVQAGEQAGVAMV